MSNYVYTNNAQINCFVQLQVEFVIGRDIKAETIDDIVKVLENWYVHSFDSPSFVVLFHNRFQIK